MSVNEKNIYPESVDTRVALLEQSIKSINQTLIRIETEMKDFRKEIKFDMTELRNDVKETRREMKNDFRWLLTIIAGLAGIMAHGFHWF